MELVWVSRGHTIGVPLPIHLPDASNEVHLNLNDVLYVLQNLCELKIDIQDACESVDMQTLPIV